MKVHAVVATWSENGNPQSEVIGVYKDVNHARYMASSLNYRHRLNPVPGVIGYFADWHEVEVE
ncbi:MAG: hypothetical protein ACRDCE_08705 [Cetobacterium sp.]|uniref:hypothetical protein n=1 Tax=Cetobacterium sp. TaxID=2071632 RepID=UPI003EE517E1